MDIEKSKHFYNDILDQKVTIDFGRNVGFEGAFSIWEKNYALHLTFQEKNKDIIVGLTTLKYTLKPRH